ELFQTTGSLPPVRVCAKRQTVEATPSVRMQRISLSQARMIGLPCERYVDMHTGSSWLARALFQERCPSSTHSAGMLRGAMSAVVPARAFRRRTRMFMYTAHAA